MKPHVMKLTFFTMMTIFGCGDDAAEPLKVAESMPITRDPRALESAPPASALALAGGGVDATALASASDEVLGERLLPGEHGRARELRSEHYIAHSDGPTQSFVVARKEGVVAPETRATVARPDVLEQRSMQIAEALGIRLDEVGAVEQRELMQQSSGSDGALTAPVLVAHKTFISRALHGIEVQGSRLVVSHDPGGRLQRIVGVWPALAADGHQLTTRLSPRQLIERAERSLAAHDLVDREVKLRYVYVPEDAAAGEVRLRLHVAAFVSGLPDSMSGPQELLIGTGP